MKRSIGSYDLLLELTDCSIHFNAFFVILFRQWEEERQRGEGTIPDLEVWLRRVIHEADLEGWTCPIQMSTTRFCYQILHQ